MSPRRTLPALRHRPAPRHTRAQQRLRNPVHNQIRIPSNRRREVCIRRRRQRKVPLVLLRIPRLLQRSQHQVAQNPLLRLAFDPRRQLLIHPRRHGDVLGHFVRPRLPPAALRLASISTGLNAFDGQRPQAKRIAEARSQLLELDNTARLRPFMDAIERRHAQVFKPRRHALVGRQHELLDQPVGPCPLRTRHAAHLALVVELDHRLGQIEVDRPALLAPLVHLHRE